MKQRTMKYMITATAFMAVCAGVAGAQKTRLSEARRPDPLDYPVTVRVSHARLMRPFVTTTGDQGASSYLHLDALIDGKHVELEANAGALLHVGDYRARIITNTDTKAGFFSRSYELLFNDGTHVLFNEVAETE